VRLPQRHPPAWRLDESAPLADHLARKKCQPFVAVCADTLLSVLVRSVFNVSHSVKVPPE